MSDLAERVAALRAAGGEVFDPLGFGLVESLVARAEALGGGARERLLARARARVDAIDATLRAARGAAEQALHVLAADDGPIVPALAAALARGEVARVERETRRAIRDRARARREVQVPWLARLRGEALSRGTRLPAEIARTLDGLGTTDGAAPRGAHGGAVAAGAALSHALFREAAESARATLAVARAVDGMPDDAGPYNGQVLAARALARMAELSPQYVRVIVAAADDLAALEAMLAVEAETGKGRAKSDKRKRAQSPAKRTGAAQRGSRSAT
jgi:hypothetical protein